MHTVTFQRGPAHGKVLKFTGRVPSVFYAPIKPSRDLLSADRPVNVSRERWRCRYLVTKVAERQYVARLAGIESV